MNKTGYNISMVNKEKYPKTKEIIDSKIGHARLKQIELQQKAELYDNNANQLGPILAEIKLLDEEIKHWLAISESELFNK